PWAGISGQEVDAAMAETLGMDRPGGVIISELHPQSPFRVAGLEVGDVVTAVDGMAVNTPPEMIYRMSVAGLGERADVTFQRRGREKSARVDMLNAPEDPPRDGLVTDRRTASPGLAVQTLNPAVVAEMGLPTGLEGVVITDPGALGARVGLRPGDVVQQINGIDIQTTAELEEALTDVGRRLDLGLIRGGQGMTLRLRL
ncbi:MAG: PDZ domain-containing protein, partial [Pseudomonadota bacterium]|nr:PDZ domain-containing protein [Pseudomonadota bacterium]